MKLGQHGKALTQAKKAVDKKPDFEDAKKLIKSIEYTTNAKAVPEAEQDAEAQSLPKVSKIILHKASFFENRRRVCLL